MIEQRYGLLLVAIIIVLTTQWHLSDSPEPPRHDAVRYADYLFNLSAYQTFGLSYGVTDIAPAPGAANSPLYPALASFFVTKKSSQSLSCLLKTTRRWDCPTPGTSCGPEPSSATCDIHLESIILFNYLLVAISLLLCGALAYSVTGSLLYFYLTPLFAFLAFQLTGYGQRLLVVNLVVPLFLALQLALASFFKDRSNRRFASILASIAGLLTGLLTLTRPEYLYLLPIVLGCFWWLSKNILHPVLLALTFLITLTPWLWRNLDQFNETALIHSDYGAHVASERIALNAMFWTQWGVSFIYWLPDSGDKLARFMFSETLSGAFNNESPHSIFVQSGSIEVEGSTLKVLASGFLAAPVKHIAVTIALAWRGLFVAKLWGFIALIGYLLLLRQQIRSGCFTLLWVSVLPIYMLLFRAGVSLNVPRYNTPMIGLFSMGWVYLGNLTYQTFKHEKLPG